MLKRRLVTVLFVLFAFWGFSTPDLLGESSASDLPSADHLVDIRVTQHSDGTRCVLTGDGVIRDYDAFTLKDPLRIVLDIRDVSPTLDSMEYPVSSQELARVRVGTHPNRVRIVFDIAEGLEAIPPYRMEEDRERLLVYLGEAAEAKEVEEEEVKGEEEIARSFDQASESQAPEPSDSDNLTQATEGKVEENKDTPPEEEVSEETQGEKSLQAVSEGGRPSEKLSLQEAIEIALENNFAILSAKEAIEGSEHKRKSALADFFPKLSVQGSYSWLSEQPTSTQAGAKPVAHEGIVVLSPTPPTTVPVGKQQPWSVQGSAIQPVFTGGALVNRYRLARIGVDSARTALERSKQDLSLQVVRDFFEVLNAIAQKRVADKAVELLQSQRNVSQEFFNVGMIPKNELLQTEVQLAERIREQTRAINAIELAKAQFNVTLQRPVESPVELRVPPRKYIPYPVEVDEAIRKAHQNRLEIEEQSLKVAASERQVRLEQSKYFPQIQLSYNLFKTEGRSFSALEEGWTVEAGVSWNFWEWGKKHHDVSAARSQLLRDRYDLMQLKDQIALEVEEAYLALTAAERNIFVAEKAVEQGEENFRMNQERYKEQVGTITEVLDAETLLRQAEADYFNSLRNYNVAKAALRRAMGLKVYDPADEMPAETPPAVQ